MEPENLARAAGRVLLSPSAVRAFVDEIRSEDPIAAIGAAIDASDERAVTVLAIAASEAGRPLGSALLRRILPLVEDIRVALALVFACPDDPLAMLLEVAASEELSHERQAAVLWSAVEKLEGRPAPKELISLLRLTARHHLGPQAAALVALSARALGDTGLLTVAEPWLRGRDENHLAALARGLTAIRESTPLESLRDAPLDASETPTIRREVPKIGRNDPCPCGSGRKFKKCCEGKALVPLPAESEPPRRRIPDGEFRRLRPAALARLSLDTLSTLQVIGAIGTFSQYRRWADAERALEELDRRTGLPGGATADDHRIQLIYTAIEAGARDVVERTIARLGDRSLIDDDLKIDLALLDGVGPVLEQIEARAREGLSHYDGQATLVELAYSLLRHSPALGIVFARGVVTPERSLDSEMLVEAVEEARDRLGLPPGDVAELILELMESEHIDRQVEESSRTKDTKLREEAEALRKESRLAAGKIAALESELRAKSAALDLARHAGAGSSAAPRADEAEIARLREKVDELKGLIREGNENRTQLRKQVASLGERLLAARKTTVETAAGDPREAHDLESPAPPMRLRVLVPAFAREARDALERVPQDTAAKALEVVGWLAGADEAAWKGVKLLEAVPHVRSARVGLHYRLLFEPCPEERELRILDLVPRQALETAIKRFRR